MSGTITLKHYASKRFWSCFDKLPNTIQVRAKEKYQILKQDPHHPSLRFAQKINSRFWSARVTRNYRALAIDQGEGCFLWVWIGTHQDYDKLLSSN